jgi:hypothetical protein
MTPDPLIAVLDQLAAAREHLGKLDTREASHIDQLTSQLSRLADQVATLSRAIAEDAAALARLDALDQQVAKLTRQLTSPAKQDDDGYQPRLAPPWWKLAGDERQVPLAELRDWAERVYRPGYGHLAGTLASCWPEHDLCLYALDIASQLWCALYLQPARSTGLLSAQAEYQVRILPAIAAQLAEETTRCGHHPSSAYHRSTP